GGCNAQVERRAGDLVDQQWQREEGNRAAEIRDGLSRPIFPEITTEARGRLRNSLITVCHRDLLYRSLVFVRQGRFRGHGHRCTRYLQIWRSHEHGDEDTIYQAIRFGFLVQNIINERLQSLLIVPCTLRRE